MPLPSSSPISSGELFSCSLSQETPGFCVSVRSMLEPCFLAACCSSVFSKYLSFVWAKKWISLLFIPSLQRLLVYTLLDRGQGTHLNICLLVASLWSAWLNHVNSHPPGPGHPHLDPFARKQGAPGCCSCSPAPGMPREIYLPDLLATGKVM